MHSGLPIVALLAICMATPSFATDRGHKPPETTPAVVYRDKSDDHDLIGLAVGIGIGYWLAHRRAKRSRPPPDVRIVPAECPVVQCPNCDVQTERALQQCLSK